MISDGLSEEDDWGLFDGEGLGLAAHNG